jgi:hypothetical protein
LRDRFTALYEAAPVCSYADSREPGHSARRERAMSDVIEIDPAAPSKHSASQRNLGFV